ncbi:transcriptional repressor [Mycobacterium phage MarkPhew]|uniref:Immunity repressor n=1 Tax=Mycobacterium phage MarkPhew TaxID=2725625 RepID=A0A6M3SWJ0_9CAUD|nr:transcriptional repressor [Mycobacterium phage MarkPhew]QJD50346.1 immunity repressor [Mycobacterium phage MarkPhew]
MDDSDKSLAAVLGYLVGRPLKLREILEALQMSRSRYYVQIDDGTLIRPDNLVRAANNLGINAIDLLARFSLISDEAVLEYAATLQGSVNPTRRTTVTGGTETMTRNRRRSISELSVRPGATAL